VDPGRDLAPARVAGQELVPDPAAGPGKGPGMGRAAGPAQGQGTVPAAAREWVLARDKGPRPPKGEPDTAGKAGTVDRVAIRRRDPLGTEGSADAADKEGEPRIPSTSVPSHAGALWQDFSDASRPVNPKPLAEGGWSARLN
jgi:hypothetical protein